MLHRPHCSGHAPSPPDDEPTAWFSLELLEADVESLHVVVVLSFLLSASILRTMDSTKVLENFYWHPTFFLFSFNQQRSI